MKYMIVFFLIHTIVLPIRALYIESEFTEKSLLVKKQPPLVWPNSSDQKLIEKKFVKHIKNVCSSNVSAPKEYFLQGDQNLNEIKVIRFVLAGTIDRFWPSNKHSLSSYKEFVHSLNDLRVLCVVSINNRSHFCAAIQKHKNEPLVIGTLDQVEILKHIDFANINIPDTSICLFFNEYPGLQGVVLNETEKHDTMMALNTFKKDSFVSDNNYTTFIQSVKSKIVGSTE